MHIDYALNRPITCQQFVELLQATTLGARRPLEDETCIQGMLDHAGLIVTAWDGDRLIGVARSVTDFHYCCYLSDLAVAQDVQARGIGTELIRRTFGALKPGCKMILLSAPQATGYYPKIGFAAHSSAWVMNGVDELC